MDTQCTSVVSKTLLEPPYPAGFHPTNHYPPVEGRNERCDFGDGNKPCGEGPWSAQKTLPFKHFEEAMPYLKFKKFKYLRFGKKLQVLGVAPLQ